jgi:hypothetical protein
MPKKFLSALFAACLFAAEAGAKTEDFYVQAVGRANKSVLIMTHFMLHDELISALAKFGKQKVKIITTHPDHAADLSRAGFQVRAPKEYINLDVNIMIIDNRRVVYISDYWEAIAREDPDAIAWALGHWNQEWATIKNKPPARPTSEE